MQFSRNKLSRANDDLLSWIFKAGGNRLYIEPIMDKMMYQNAWLVKLPCGLFPFTYGNFSLPRAPALPTPSRSSHNKGNDFGFISRRAH